MRYFLRKLAMFALTLWAAVTLNFIIPRLMPGSPVQAALSRLAATGQTVTEAMKRAVEIQLGLPHTSLWAQYGDYLIGIMHLGLA